MARSSSFFGLRRGSTKSLTFSVLNGKQITKDRVTSVRNPNSTAQINQRMRLAAANVIYRYWKDYIDRGQQNVAYGEKSRLAWLSSVLKSPLYIAKGGTSYLPWNFPLTRGSLTPFDCSKSAIGMVQNLIAPYSVSDAANLTDAQILAVNPQLKEGDQIAVVGMYRDANENIKMVEIKHYLTGNTTLAADAAAAGVEITLSPRGTAPEDGETDYRYRITTFDAPQFTWEAFTCILSRLEGNSYQRSTQEVVANGTDALFTTTYVQYLMSTWKNEGKTVDWPEIQGTFTPMGYKSLLMHSTEDDTNSEENILIVYGVDEQGYKAFAVTKAGLTSTGPLINDSNVFSDPSFAQHPAITYVSATSDSRLLSSGNVEASVLANGVISYNEFKAVFG